MKLVRTELQETLEVLVHLVVTVTLELLASLDSEANLEHLDSLSQALLVLLVSQADLAMMAHPVTKEHLDHKARKVPPAALVNRAANQVHPVLQVALDSEETTELLATPVLPVETATPVLPALNPDPKDPKDPLVALVSPELLAKTVSLVLLALLAKTDSPVDPELLVDQDSPENQVATDSPVDLETLVSLVDQDQPDLKAALARKV